MNKPSSRRTPRRAFTLIEVLVTLFVGMVFMAMLLSLTVAVVSGLTESERKVAVDRDFRSASSSLTALAECADYIYVYDTFNNPDKLAPMGAGQHGDYFVMVYYKNPGKVDPITGEMDTTIARIAGVYRIRSGAGDSAGAVYKFDSAFDNWGVNFPATGHASTLLPSTSYASRFTKLASQVYASANSDVGDGGRRVFTNVNGTGVMMLGRLRSGSDAKFNSAGYTFAISSRNL